MSEMDLLYEEFRKWYEEKYHHHASKNSAAWAAYLLKYLEISALKDKIKMYEKLFVLYQCELSSVVEKLGSEYQKEKNK